MHSILEKLPGGDLRSIGRSEEVAQEIVDNPALFAQVFAGLFHDDARIRMRAADALEKASAQNPSLLLPFKQALIEQVALIPQQEVQWHAAQMFAYLELSAEEQQRVIRILYGYLDTSASNIVKVSALQTLGHMAMGSAAVRADMITRIQQEMAKGSPAVITRGKKLLTQLTK
ncbi:MAG: hypothetical protein U0694_15660 [Anaerolineae bacterium]